MRELLVRIVLDDNDIGKIAQHQMMAAEDVTDNVATSWVQEQISARLDELDESEEEDFGSEPAEDDDDFSQPGN